ncbi:hypothetical protein GCM10027072_59800 [Streptomyces bullii]
MQANRHHRHDERRANGRRDGNRNEQHGRRKTVDRTGRLERERAVRAELGGCQDQWCDAST